MFSKYFGTNDEEWNQSNRDFLNAFPVKDNSSIEETTQEIILKNQSLQSSKIKKYVPEFTERKTNYELKNLDEYIGQKNAKEQIKTAVKIIKELKPTHILLNGWAGTGKSTLMNIIANMLNANLIYRVPEQLQNVDDLLVIINQIQENEKLTIFALDEIHTISPNIANILLPILQDLRYGDANIRPFVMIGATTDKDKLVKKQSPLVSRFLCQITLDKYSPSELTTIIKNYKNNLYPNIEIDQKDLYMIAKNSRGVPRKAIALLLKLLVTKDIDKVLFQSNIIKDGLTNIDVKILTVLNENQKAMGANYLSQAVGIPQSDYEIIYERYLIEKGLVIRSRSGRVISEQGINFLNNIKRRNKK